MFFAYLLDVKGEWLKWYPLVRAPASEGKTLKKLAIKQTLRQNYMPYKFLLVKPPKYCDMVNFMSQ